MYRKAQFRTEIILLIYKLQLPHHKRYGTIYNCEGGTNLYSSVLHFYSIQIQTTVTLRKGNFITVMFIM